MPSQQCGPETPVGPIWRDIEDATATAAPMSGTAGIRSTLHDLLSPGRAVSTAELRMRIQDSGFGHTTHEAVYPQLVSLAGRGLVRKLGRHNGRRHTFWAAYRYPRPDSTPTGMTVRPLGRNFSSGAKGVDSVH